MFMAASSINWVSFLISTFQPVSLAQFMEEAAINTEEADIDVEEAEIDIEETDIDVEEAEIDGQDS
ncbi:MAG TPA: hypothetical protein GXX58_01490 [Gelria sp.]|nr:hypothetical protein [Gelria sp.]